MASQDERIKWLKSLTYSHHVPRLFHPFFWMANPESYIFVSLADIEYVARVDGCVNSHDGCSELGIWPFTDEQRAFIDHFGDHIEKRALPCFGNLALVPCPFGRKSTCEERYIMISIN
jgi:hypothetical protein